MKSKCCRDTPRCSSCPVLAMAAARRRQELSKVAGLVDEIFVGRREPRLPSCVAAALDDLEAARRATLSLAAEYTHAR